MSFAGERKDLLSQLDQLTRQKLKIIIAKTVRVGCYSIEELLQESLRTCI